MSPAAGIALFVISVLFISLAVEVVWVQDTSSSTAPASAACTLQTTPSASFSLQGATNMSWPTTDIAVRVELNAWHCAKPAVLYVHNFVDIISDEVKRSHKPYCPEAVGSALCELQRLSPGKELVVVDVGSNIGSCAIVAGSLHHKVYAFEPVAANLALLRANVHANLVAAHVSVIGKGVSDGTEASVVIRKEKGNLGNSMIASEQEDMHRFGNGGHEFPAEVIVLTTLDTVVTEHVALLKMDCQGYELKALLGAERLLRYYGVEVLELEFSPAMLRHASGPDAPQQLLRLLYAHGFTCRRDHDRGALLAKDEAAVQQYVSDVGSSFPDLFCV